MQSPLLRAALITLMLGASVAWAAEDPKPDAPKADAAKPADKDKNDVLALLPADSVTKHHITAGGHDLAYTATAGTLALRDEKGDPSAEIFYVAYVLDGQKPETRPISFFFNGGPGAGSAYLHLGAAGPQALEFPAGNETDGGHAVLRDNRDTWLPFTDMVFIDPVGTGFSRAAKPEEAEKRFWGVKQDGEANAKTIALWLAGHGRAASPKYLVGESYGGIRSLKTASALQHDQGVLVNGILMVSPYIDGQFFFTDNPMRYALQLPSFAAAALDGREALTADAIDDAYHYATTDYLQTLVGPPPTGDAAASFYQHVADVSGVPEPVVAKERALLEPGAHDVRSRDGRLYSLYDRTLSIADPAPEGVNDDDSPEPLLEGYGRAYGNAMTGYVADALGFRTELTYHLLDMEVNGKWDWTEDHHNAASGVPDMKKLLALNPSLHITVVHGYFDMVCPFGVTRWITEHLPVGRDRVRLAVYPGGHMLYTRPGSRASLAHEAESLITGLAP